MRSAPSRDSRLQPRWGIPAFFELLGLWAVTVAYPTLSAAVSGPEGLTAVRADRLDAILFVLIVLIPVPLLAFLIEAVVRRTMGPRLTIQVHSGLVGLFGLPVFVRTVSGAGFDGYGVLIVAVILTIGFSLLYWYTRFGSNLVRVLSFATPVVLVAFALSTPVQSLFTPQERSTEPLKAERTPPVVYLLLDEFPLASLEKHPGKIDGVRFPNFSRLAERSTWYSRARTEADSTVLAVPMMVSGTHQTDDRPAPGLADYPDNFMSVLARAGYDVYGSEWITDLCPHEVCPRSRDFRRRFFRFLTNGLTFGRPLPLPSDSDLDLTAALRRRLDLQPGQPFRVHELVNAIRAGKDDAFFLHLMLPHVPWIMLPDGRTHDAPSVILEFEGSDGRIHQDVQRMLLQIQFVDHALGRIMKAMEDAGIWDESIFVVTADHGAMMNGGGSRREISEENAAWIAPVPLFIKYPEQQRGRQVTRPVTTGNIFPTIADELGLGLSMPGRHHLDSPRAEVSEHRISSADSEWVTISEAEVQRKYEAALLDLRTAFPSSELFATDGAAYMLHKRIESTEGLDRVPHRLNDEDKFKDVRLDRTPLPLYISGTIEDPALTERSSLVVAVNDRIASTMKPWREDGKLVFGTVASPQHLVNGNNTVDIFVRAAP